MKIKTILFLFVLLASIGCFAEEEDCERLLQDPEMSVISDDTAGDFNFYYPKNLCELNNEIHPKIIEYIQSIKRMEGKGVVELLHEVGEVFCVWSYGECNEESFYWRFVKSCLDARTKSIEDMTKAVQGNTDESTSAISWTDTAWYVEESTWSAGWTDTGSDNVATDVLQSLSFDYKFSTAITDTDPGVWYARFNNATFGSITQVFIDDQEVDTTDIQTWLRTLSNSTETLRVSVRIFKKTDPSVFSDFQITAFTEAVGYWKITAIPISSNGSLKNNDDIVIRFDFISNNWTTGNNWTTSDTGNRGGAVTSTRSGVWETWATIESSDWPASTWSGWSNAPIENINSEFLKKSFEDFCPLLSENYILAYKEVAIEEVGRNHANTIEESIYVYEKSSREKMNNLHNTMDTFVKIFGNIVRAIEWFIRNVFFWWWH